MGSGKLSWKSLAGGAALAALLGPVELAAQVDFDPGLYCGRLRAVTGAASQGFAPLRGATTYENGGSKRYESIYSPLENGRCIVTSYDSDTLLLGTVECTIGMTIRDYAAGDVERFQSLFIWTEQCLHDIEVSHVLYKNDMDDKLANQYRGGTNVVWDIPHNRTSREWQMTEMNLRYEVAGSNRLILRFDARRLAN